jgi:dynein heavy chain
MELEALTSGFKQYQDGDAYEEVANRAKDIHAKIEEAVALSKKINNKETLVDYEEISDYTQIVVMQKEFRQYYDLWTTVETWKKSYESWLNDPFDELDAANVEETVDNANKIMAQCLRAFKDKDLPKILDIANGIKDAVEIFKPQVPIVIALRTDGMKERHWEMLSEKIGQKIEPVEGFTFK